MLSISWVLPPTHFMNGFAFVIIILSFLFCSKLSVGLFKIANQENNLFPHYFILYHSILNNNYKDSFFYHLLKGIFSFFDKLKLL